MQLKTDDPPHITNHASYPDNMTTIRRYDFDTLMAMNRKDLIGIPGELKIFLEALPVVKTPGHAYLNACNPALYTEPVSSGQRKTLFAKSAAFTDEKTVEDVKILLGKVTNNNYQYILEQLAKLRYSGACWAAVADVYYEATIECIFLVASYVDLLIAWTETLSPELSSGLINNFNTRVMNQLKSPREFDPALDSQSCETAADRGKRWQISNALIVCELFNRGKYPAKRIYEYLLLPAMTDVSPTNTVGLEIIIAAWPKIQAKLPTSERQPLLERLKTISEDRTYIARLRFIIKDLIEAK